MKKKAFTLIELLVVLVIIIIIATIFIGGFNVVNPSSSTNQKVIELLEQEGYSEIHLEGYQPMAGSDDDLHKIGFTARNSQNNIIHGAVTGSDWKGWTIRRF